MLQGAATVFTVLLNILPYLSCETFTALATMKSALESEQELSIELRRYVDAEQQRLQKVLQLAERYESHSAEALVEPEVYLANPVNAFLFVKRFTSEKAALQELLSSQINAQAFFAEWEARLTNLPDEEDLDGVIAALLRLQDTYQLPAGKLADGSFTRSKTGPSMSALDCFELGKHAYHQQDWHHMLTWLGQSLETWQSEVNKTVSKIVLLDYLSYALSMQGNLHHAMALTEEWLTMDPTHERAQQNMEYFQNMIAKETEELVSKGLPVPKSAAELPIKNERTSDWYRQSKEFQTYEALCRGEDVKPNRYANKLTCYYHTAGGHPLLILSPVKTEEYFLNPYIVLYHDVITDQQIDIVKELATPKLKRATVNDPATGKLVTAQYRVSRSAWLRDYEHSLIASISHRLDAVTGLSMERAEELQVVNYGIGGQYEPHFDFARNVGPEKQAFEEEDGNRIATWMFYLSEVDSGGYTVFVDIGLKVPPVKGAAIFWWNLKKSGDGDEKTRHAGCPVLTGSKWVANKWIHERDQVFRRPCGLSKVD